MAHTWKAVAGGMLVTEVRVERQTGTVGPGGGWIPGEPETIVERIRASIEPVPISAQLREHLVAGGPETKVTHLVRMWREAALEVQAADVLIELEGPDPRRLEILNRVDFREDGEIHCICIEQEAA